MNKEFIINYTYNVCMNNIDIIVMSPFVEIM